jgi:hypothetical protein
MVMGAQAGTPFCGKWRSAAAIGPGSALRLSLAALALALPAATVRAQSLEQTYASLCRTDEQKQGESCVALRKALMEKLQAEMGNSPPAATQTARAPVAIDSPPVAQRPAPDPARVKAQWGMMADLVGRAWASNTGGYRTIQYLEWETPGEVIVFHVAGLDPKNKILTAPMTSRLSLTDFSKAYGTVGADGSLTRQVDTKYGDKPLTIRTVMRLTGPSSFEEDTKKLSGEAWKHFVTVRYQAVPLTGQANIQRAIAYFQTPPSNSGGGGGGLLGALGGAMVGAMAGGNTSQVVGAAMKGAAIVDPNAAALGSVGDSLISGNTASVGGMGGLGNASGGGGSYPTRPNLLDGSPACSMMNQNNYRDVSLSGGNDVQLKTMCGQAFEYYHMYLNAISQGYSEADANRTYAAHQGAAQNAIAFYQNNR